MSVSNISGYSSIASLYQTSSTTNSQQVNGQEGQMPPPPPPPEGEEGGLMSSLSDALSQMGISRLLRQHIISQ